MLWRSLRKVRYSHKHFQNQVPIFFHYDVALAPSGKPSLTPCKAAEVSQQCLHWLVFVP